MEKETLIKDILSLRSDLKGQIEENIEVEELENLKEGLIACSGDEIHVNDVGECFVTHDDNTYVAHLVIEQDSSVRWYLNPDDRGDLVIRELSVRKKDIPDKPVVSDKTEFKVGDSVIVSRLPEDIFSEDGWCGTIEKIVGDIVKVRDQDDELWDTYSYQIKKEDEK
jgi:hypothetical protein